MAFGRLRKKKHDDADAPEQPDAAPAADDAPEAAAVDAAATADTAPVSADEDAADDAAGALIELLQERIGGGLGEAEVERP